MSTGSDAYTGAEDEEIEASESDRYRILAAERRRVALEVLADCRLPVSLAELATDVAAREGDADAADGSAVERVAITFHHHHLPKMHDAGVLDYDPDSKQVEALRTTLDRLAD